MGKLSIKSFTKDVSLNFIASIILTGILQIVVYPVIGKKLNPQNFGTIITLMGIINIIALTVGGSLNNIRLITKKDYMHHDTSGDFNIILSFATLTSVISIVVVLKLFGRIFNVIDILSIILILLLTIMRLYLSVEYRLKINYTRILMQNICAGCGYLIGAGLAYYTKIWYFPFIIGESFSFIYALNTTELIHEPLTRTPLFTSTMTKYLQLAFSVLIANSLIYLDRLVIYPFLGGGSVGIYFSASLLGKTLGIIMLPIAGVLLTYFADSNRKLTFKEFWSINLIVTFSAIIFYVISIFVGPWVTQLLYPSLASKAIPILSLANLAAIISMVGSTCQPALMRYSKLSWQIVIQVVYGIVYIGGGVVMIKSLGLYGFCLAAIFASVIRLALIWAIGSFEFSKPQL